ncbi:EAL domain-containing protein [Vibrio sonorensis]|uniref:EAL domain-containing protein n=1 Tax=Vibrio sonorensis TaxID=1004316 RepID=UPI001586F279|nr:EAL domain-containing protein [Vibrio sonorensis]
MNEAFGYLPNLLPVVLIFSAVFVLSFVANIFFTEKSVQRHGQSSVQTLETYLTQKSKDLLRLETQYSNQCSPLDVTGLRSFIFDSHMVKEVGLFKNGRVYCSSNGDNTPRAIPKDLHQRLQDSTGLSTVSLAHPAQKIQALSIFAQNGNDSGAYATLPIQQFVDLIVPALTERHYGYKIEVLNRVIATEAGTDQSGFSQQAFTSENYPIAVTLYLNAATYQHYATNNIWQTIILASLLSLFYLLVRYKTLAKRSMEFSLLSAIEQDQIDLYLQPIIDSDTHALAGSEALVRWNHPTQGQISPEIFIPLAEKLGVIDQITERTIQKVTEFIYINQAQIKGKYISINLSRSLVLSPEFMDYLRGYAFKHPTVVKQLLLEITEDIHFSPRQLDTALRALRELNDLGFKIAIDDFGTGYSGLNFIRLHSFHVMKIDKVFIKALHSDASITPVLASMIQLGKELGMKIIAEGVETEEQLVQLKKLGVKYIQGFYYSYPVKPEELLKLGNNLVAPQLEQVRVYQ